MLRTIFLALALASASGNPFLRQFLRGYTVGPLGELQVTIKKLILNFKLFKF